MDKRRDHDEGPGLQGPDYFSLVIEWEQPEEQSASSVQAVDEDEITDRHVKHWDIVDEASDESFPASDPPAWGGSVAAASAETAQQCDPVVQGGDLEPARFPWLTARIGKIAGVIGAAIAVTAYVWRMRRHAHA